MKWFSAIRRHERRSKIVRHRRRRSFERLESRDLFTAAIDVQLPDAGDGGNYQQVTGEIRGTKWHDVDGDGIRDAGEPGLSNWMIYLDLSQDGQWQAGEPCTLTDADGNYAFTNLVPGMYWVADQMQVGWQTTTGFSQAFEGGTLDVSRWVVGGRPVAWTPAEQGGWSWSHTLARDAGDPDGYLRVEEHGPATGNSYGATPWLRSTYNFNDGRSHVINFTWKADVAESHVNRYFVQIVDGDNLPTFEQEHWGDGPASNPTNSFLNRPVDGVTNLLWRDTATGRAPGAEYARSSGKQPWSIVIDPSGVVRLYDSPNGGGTMLAQETLETRQAWYLRMMMYDGTSAGFPAGDSRINLYSFDATNRHAVLLTPSQVARGLDFGSQQLAEIRGTKWNDLDGDGVRDEGEPGLAGWTVYADLNENGRLDIGEPSTVTAADGSYRFANLTPGQYTVSEVVQPGWRATSPDLLHFFGNPSPAAADDFGGAVAVRGNDVLVAARGDDTAATDAGAAYLFDGTTGRLVRTFLGEATGDNFGYSVAAGDDMLVIGALSRDGGVGSAYLFDRATGTLLQKFRNPTPRASEYFGSAVAVHGNYVLVAAQSDDPGDASMRGAVYLYDAATGTLLHTFEPDRPVARQSFGKSVAFVGDDKILIGAECDDSLGFDHGAAYLFDLSGNLLHKFFAPSSENYWYFGRSVATLGDDLLIASYNSTYLFDGATYELLLTLPTGGAVAAVGGDVATCRVGSSTVQLYDGETGVLLKTYTSPTPDLGSPAAFGADLLVGASKDAEDGVDTGGVYLFRGVGVSTRSGIHRVSLVPGQIITGLEFGNQQLAEIHGTKVHDLNGDGKLGPDERGLEGWTILLGEITGTTVDQSSLPAWAGGWTNIVPENKAGQTFQPEMTVLTGVDIDVVTGNPGRGGDTITVEVGKDAEVLATASRTVTDGYSGLLHFDLPAVLGVTAGDTYTLWVHDTGKVNFGWKYREDTYFRGTRLFGGQAATGDFLFRTYGAQGATAAVTDADGNYQFTNLVPGDYAVAEVVQPGWGATSPDLLHRFRNPTPATGDGFGGTVATAGDNLLIGAPGDDLAALDAGAVYLVAGAGGSLLHTFPGHAAGEAFGSAVAADANNVVIGAPDKDGRAGAAYVYTFDGSQWTSWELPNPTPNPNEFFGGSVAIMGNYVLVAAARDNPGGLSDRGEVYLYNISTHSEERRFQPSDPLAADLDFGKSVAFVGADKVLIGAQREGSGVAYLFDLATGTLLHKYTSPEPDVYFGRSVAGRGDDVLIAGWNHTSLFRGVAPYDALLPAFAPGQDVSVVGSQVAIVPCGGTTTSLYDGQTGALVNRYSISGPDFINQAAAFGKDVLIGAPGEDTDGTDAGAVYLFRGAGVSTRSGIHRVSVGPGQVATGVDFGNSCDQDVDGIAGIVEAAAPNGGDGNQDGKPDAEQPNVASFPNSTDGQYLTLVVAETMNLVGVGARNNPSPNDAPADADFRNGFFDFTMRGMHEAAAATVTVLFEPGTSANSYYKFGPTPDNPTPHWYSFLFDGVTGAVIFADRIELHFVDGLRGDDDLLKNGRIVDIGAPAMRQHPWQHPSRPCDVNNDGSVSPLDALEVINDINHSGIRRLPQAPQRPAQLPPYLDVSGDDALDPIDVLRVINFINGDVGAGEGEAGADTAGPAVLRPLYEDFGVARPVGPQVSASQAATEPGGANARRDNAVPTRTLNLGPTISGRARGSRSASLRGPALDSVMQTLDVPLTPLDAVLPDLVDDIDRVWRAR